MGVTPEFQVVVREVNRQIMGHTNDVDVRDVTQPTADIGGIRRDRVMVARQDHHMTARFIQQIRCTGQDRFRLPVVVEDVANQQDKIGVMGAGRVQHDTQSRGAVVAIAGFGGMVVDMQVGAVHEQDVIGGRSGHGAGCPFGEG